MAKKRGEGEEGEVSSSKWEASSGSDLMSKMAMLMDLKTLAL